MGSLVKLVREHPLVTAALCLVIHELTSNGLALLFSVLGIVNPVLSVALAYFSDVVVIGVCAFVLYALGPEKIPCTGASVRADGKSKAAWIATGVLMFPLVWLSGSILSTIIFTSGLAGEGVADAYQKAMTALPAAYVVLTVTLAPLAEELLYRGVLFGRLMSMEHVSPMVAAIITSVVFSLAHGTLYHLPSTFLLSLFSCWALAETKDIRVSIAIHVLYNGCTLLLQGIQIPQMMLSIPVGVTLWVVIAAVLCLLLKQVRSWPSDKPRVIQNDEEVIVNVKEW